MCNTVNLSTFHGAIQNTRAYVITQKLMHITNSYNRNKFNQQMNFYNVCIQSSIALHGAANKFTAFMLT